MIQHSVTESAAALCNTLMADPACEPGKRSIARQLLAFVESVRNDSSNDQFYEECIRYIVADMTDHVRRIAA